MPNPMVAQIGSSVAGAAGSLIGGSKQADAAEEAADIQNQMLERQIGLQQPYIDAGTSALPALSAMTMAGLPGQTVPLSQSGQVPQSQTLSQSQAQSQPQPPAQSPVQPMMPNRIGLAARPQTQHIMRDNLDRWGPMRQQPPQTTQQSAQDQIVPEQTYEVPEDMSMLDYLGPEQTRLYNRLEQLSKPSGREKRAYRQLRGLRRDIEGMKDGQEVERLRKDANRLRDLSSQMETLSQDPFDESVMGYISPEQQQALETMQEATYAPLGENPYYQWRTDEAQEAIDRFAASRGQYDSSATLEQLADQQRALTAEETEKQFARANSLLGDTTGLQQWEYGKRMGGLGSAAGVTGAAANVTQNVFGNRLSALTGAAGLAGNEFNMGAQMRGSRLQAIPQLWDMGQGQEQQSYNRLFDLAQMGQNAASRTGAAMRGAGNNLSNIAMQRGEGQAQMWSGLGAMPMQGMNNYMMGKALGVYGNQGQAPSGALPAIPSNSYFDQPYQPNFGLSGMNSGILYG